MSICQSVNPKMEKQTSKHTEEKQEEEVGAEASSLPRERGRAGSEEKEGREVGAEASKRGQAKEEIWRPGDGVVNKRERGILLGFKRAGNPHVRQLPDMERWPAEVGTCKTWTRDETTRVSKGDEEFLRRLTFPYGKEMSFSLPKFQNITRCETCTFGLRQIRRFLTTGEWSDDDDSSE